MENNTKQFSKIYVFLDDKERDFPTLTKYEFNQEEFTELNQRGYGAFQSVNSFDRTQPLTEKTYRCDKYLSRLDYVYADLDVAKRGDGQTDEEKKIKKEAKLQEVLPFKPTKIIETANGIQPYWRIKDGGITTESKLKYENIVWSIICKFNGDPGAKDSSRILRIPNFYHNKGTPFLCKIIHEETVEYTLDELSQKFPFTAKEGETIKSKVDFWESLKQGFPEGNRHSAFLSLCLSMLRGKTENDFGNVWLLMESTYYQKAKDTKGFSIEDAKVCFEQACKYWKEWDKDTTVTEHKIVSVNELLKMEPKKQPFLLYGMIVEGSVNALTSDSGKGKSLWMLKVVESIVRGEKFLGMFETKKTKTLILDLEMSENDLIQRTKSIIQSELEGLDFYHSQTFNICDEKDFNWLVDKIKSNGYGLVVFDTYSMMKGSEIDENSNDDANIINAKFLELIRNCGITILFVHHHRKPSKGEKYSQSSSRGATDIIGKTASHILLDSRDIIVANEGEGMKGIKLTIEQMKRRQAEGFERFSVIVWYNPLTKKSTFEFGGYEEKAESAIDKARSAILNFVKKGSEYTMAEIKEEVGGTSNTKMAVDQLVESKIMGSRKQNEGETIIRGGKKVSKSAFLFFLVKE